MVNNNNYDGLIADLETQNRLLRQVLQEVLEECSDLDSNSSLSDDLNDKIIRVLDDDYDDLLEAMDE